jgi:hypothetical protein
LRFYGKVEKERDGLSVSEWPYYLHHEFGFKVYRVGIEFTHHSLHPRVERYFCIKLFQAFKSAKDSPIISSNGEFLEAFVDTFEVEFKDYDDFVKRYGKPISRNEVPMSFMMMDTSAHL